MKKKLHFIICALSVLFLSKTPVLGQRWQDLREQNANFNDVKRAFESEYSTTRLEHIREELAREVVRPERGRGRDKFEKEMEGAVQYMRWKRFVEPRVAESGGDLNAIAVGTNRAMATMRQTASARTAANWRFVGPTSTPANGGNGRVTTVRVQPNNDSILYAATPAGGLFKSVNKGASWLPITDMIAALGASDVAIDPTNPNTLYVATGDGESNDTRSVGVYKSTDGGASWQVTGLNWTLQQGLFLSRILVHPTNPQIVIAGGSAGIWRSTNAGTTWTKVSTLNIRDLEFKTSNPDTIYAGGYGFAFARSTNGGVTWTNTGFTGLPTAANTVIRGAVAVSPANANIVWLVTANDIDYGIDGVYQSTNGGTTWTKKNPATLNLLGWESNGADAGGQGWYDLAIAVNPTNANEVYVGGVNTWKTTNAGTSWQCASHWYGSGAPYVHADIHDLCFVGTTLYSANDGGVFKTTNGGTTWIDISSTLTNAQIYSIGLSGSSENKIVSGHQDNGTNVTLNGTTWSQNVGGDGMVCFFDRTNDNNVFASIYYGNLFRSNDGGATFTQIHTVPNADWVTPWLQDPVTPTRLYACGKRVFRSNNSGTTWTALAALPNAVLINTIDVARTNNQVIVVGGENRIFKSTNGGTNWANITNGLTGTLLTVHIDVNNENILYVGMASYTGTSVYRSENGGNTWTNISAGLPSVPVSCFATPIGTDNTVFCGTDLGVFYRDNSVTTWQPFTTGMPAVMVTDIKIFAPTQKLRVATYGRGIWQTDLAPVMASSSSTYMPPTISLTSPNANSTFAAPAAINITANAIDADGTIKMVEFYNGTTLLAKDSVAPYTYVWSNVAAGTYSLTAKAIDNIGANTISTAISVTVTSTAPANEAALTTINAPRGTSSTTSVTPSVVFKNNGSAVLTSLRIHSKIDNRTEKVFSWTGNAAVGASVTVVLDTFAGISVGAHTFVARVSLPNGKKDALASNDTIRGNFTMTAPATCTNNFEPNNIRLTPTVLTIGQAVNSQIASTTDNDWYVFYTTDKSPKVKVSLSNLPADYDIELYDLSGLSRIANSAKLGKVDELIILNTPTKGNIYNVRVKGSATAFSTTVCYTLRIDTSSQSFIAPLRAGKEALPNIDEKNESEDTPLSISLAPNPAHEYVGVTISAPEKGYYDLEVLDLTGKQVYENKVYVEENQGYTEFDVTKFPQGIYLAKLSRPNFTRIVTVKFVVN